MLFTWWSTCKVLSWPHSALNQSLRIVQSSRATWKTIQYITHYTIGRCPGHTPLGHKLDDSVHLQVAYSGRHEEKHETLIADTHFLEDHIVYTADRR